MKHKIIELEDGTEWVTDGRNEGFSIEGALDAKDLINQLKNCNCSLSINNGLLTLEDGTVVDLKAIARKINQ